jgi:SAM-dependent methyltransferase
MAVHVCPFWCGYLLNCPLRKLTHNPRKILSPYAAVGMKVLDVGCAMGFFSLPLAELVGPSGRVICVDVQEKMLKVLRRRAVNAGLAERIETRQCPADSLGLDDFNGSLDFALVFAVAHEVPDAGRFFSEIAESLKPAAKLFFGEPKLHVQNSDFERSVAIAQKHRLKIIGRPDVSRTRTALFVRE